MRRSPPPRAMRLLVAAAFAHAAAGAAFVRLAAGAAVVRLAAGAAVVLVAIGAAAAAPVIGPGGLDTPAQAIGFEGARAAPGALVSGLSRAGVHFSRPLALSPQGVGHVAGMSGAALGNHGDRGWNGALSIRFRDVMTAAAFAFATEGGTTRFTALLGGRAVESFALATGWENAGTAFVGFERIAFDEILLETDAALILIDNLQLGAAWRRPMAAAEGVSLLREPDVRVAAPVPVPASFALLAMAFGALGLFRLLRQGGRFGPQSLR